MGKPTRKIIETLVLPLEPVRYLVTNTERIILVTYDYKYAQKLANIIDKLENPRQFYVRVGNKNR
jgi:hypothetical protein